MSLPISSVESISISTCLSNYCYFRPSRSICDIHPSQSANLDQILSESNFLQFTDMPPSESSKMSSDLALDCSQWFILADATRLVSRSCGIGCAKRSTLPFFRNRDASLNLPVELPALASIDFGNFRSTRDAQCINEITTALSIVAEVK